jgi:serine/threonine protein phosphatase PrpC
MTAAAETSVRVDVAGLTDVGLKRKANDDHFVIAGLQRTVVIRQTSLPSDRVFDRLRGLEGLLMMVADGVGGRPKGALASETAITALVEYIGQAAGCFNQLDVDQEHQFLEQLEMGVLEAHRRLLTAGDPRYGPATTLTMAMLIWPRAYIVHVGDSRAFYLRKGRLRQLTRDQTTGEYLVDAGAWTEEQARSAPLASGLASALGSEELTPAIGLVDLQPGDTLMLCTDGLTKHVPDERIVELLGGGASAEAACRALVDAALAAGGTDNITTVVARA